MNISMERSKQALYQIFERNHYPKKNIEHINKIYACAFDQRNIKLSKIDKEHIEPWIKENINIDKIYSKHDYNWRDTEVLKNFKIYGIKKYKDLNIWYINWEIKRQKALELGIHSIPEEKIIDPRDISAKMAHTFLMKYQVYPFWRIGFYKLLVQKAFEKLKRKIYGTK